MGSATLTSGRTCTPTLSCPEAPPCTLVLLTACRRRSPPLPPPSSTASASAKRRGKQYTGSNRHHLHLLVSGVIPCFLFNHFPSFGHLGTRPFGCLQHSSSTLIFTFF